ncbi:hypothetical protein CKO28_21920 [Rhodovibrio sodomensis]|uniref:Uncharacterized protein n=1 Tax=Rhodovibrio sodomensis TaxID=1088 RepID=A0ABS1DJK9_9PROT|nr:hypothetical protein [Rhodovibrio sodomensis]MBK1670681.1 hypothetical protein [Rhodovibrio sodomensis]
MRIYETDIMRLAAFHAGRGAPLKPENLYAIGGSDRESYLAFVDAWKAAWHGRVMECRLAKKQQRAKGGHRWGQRACAQGRREALRGQLRALLVLRRRMKEAARLAVERERARRPAA